MFWITSLLGVLLAIAPFVLGYTTDMPAMWTSLIIGAIVVVVSLFAQFTSALDKRWEYWVLALAGLAAIAAPFVLGYSGLATALGISLVIGVILLLWDGYKALQPPPLPHH
jgi:membrane-bound ClpP family serine protease